ncbi:MAG: alkaline phosphatase family protein [Proteobacteria bacterium]|nr:alkaline phosphatase family protein [Pseudomonadota bacterium]
MPHPHLLVIELNEASEHFIRKFSSKGTLPWFARFLDEGALVRTSIPGIDPTQERYHRLISPWIIWPTVYTGLMPEEHGIVGYGQDISHLVGKWVWDVCNEQSVSHGVFGSLMSFPPRGDADFYLPEALSDTADCKPQDMRALQELFLLAAHNYSGNFLNMAATASNRLLRSMAGGTRFGTALRTLAQPLREQVQGPRVGPERAMLHSYLSFDNYHSLFLKYRPAFSTLNLNHIAYMQHRFWRASEPAAFKAQLSATDERFFKSVEARDAEERKYSHWIERGFRWMDRMLGQLADSVPDGTVIMVVTGLGQRAYDPVSEIHNPVVRLVEPEILFEKMGLSQFQVFHQMNPDVTVNFESEAAATDAGTRIGELHIEGDDPLFHIDRRGHQLFLELNVPPVLQKEPDSLIQYRRDNAFHVRASEHIWQSANNEQSTAHHEDTGLILAWQKGGRLSAAAETVPITDAAPAMLQVLGLDPQSWHKPSVDRLLVAG